MGLGKAQPRRVRVFGVDFGKEDASSVQEQPRDCQVIRFLFSKAMEASSSSTPSKILKPSSPNTPLDRSDYRHATGSDDSGEVESRVRFNNVSTALCLSDETWDQNAKKRKRETKRTDGSEVSCVPRKLSSSEEQRTARNIARMKIQSEEDKEEEQRYGVSTQVTLYSDPWTIKKVIKQSDLSNLCRLILPSGLVQEHILRYRPENDVSNTEGLSVDVLDHDTGTSHELRLKRWRSSKSYVLIGGWRKDFVLRRHLHVNDEIGLFWDRFASQFHFCVLNRAAAPSQSPN